MSREPTLTIVALLLAPTLTGAALGFLIGLEGGGEGAISTAATGLVLAAMFGWPLALVFGLPLHWLLWRRRSVTTCTMRSAAR